MHIFRTPHNGGLLVADLNHIEVTEWKDILFESFCFKKFMKKYIYIMM